MNMGPRWLGADLTRDFFQTGAEVVVGPRWLGAEVTRGRGGSGTEVSEFHIDCHAICLFVSFFDEMYILISFNYAVIKQVLSSKQYIYFFLSFH